MTRNNTQRSCLVDENLPKPQDPELDVAMADAAGDDAHHGGQDEDNQPDPVQPPNPEALGPCQQEG